MNKVRFPLRTLGFVILSLAFTSLAQAQATRTWVSGVGDDVNPCSRTAPCKTFAGAISKTAKDGEISVLDPGGFGTVTITKSIYINGTHGAGYGSILASLTNGVNVNITDVNDIRKTVRLRALDINGASTGNTGVSITSATEVHIEDTVIDGFITGNATGVRVNATASCNVFINHTEIRNNTTGVSLATSSGFAVAQITGTRLVGNTTGMTVGANSVANFKGGEISQNTTGVNVTANLSSCNLTDNQIGNNLGTAINASANGARIRLISNHIYGNATSIAIAAGATVQSDSQNRMIDNAAGVAPNGSAITLQ
jgi:hypothetical protein